jgi:hypothetical protein
MRCRRSRAGVAARFPEGKITAPRCFGVRAGPREPWCAQDIDRPDVPGCSPPGGWGRGKMAGAVSPPTAMSLAETELRSLVHTRSASDIDRVRRARNRDGRVAGRSPPGLMIAVRGGDNHGSSKQRQKPFPRRARRSDLMGLVSMPRVDNSRRITSGERPISSDI